MFAMAYDVARVRGLFPSLGDGWIHLDPQAGMQIPDSVASTVSKGFRALVSQPGGVYPAARQSQTVIDAARVAVADLVGGDPHGVVLGPTRGILLSTLAEVLPPRVWLGSTAVVSRLDDEPNVTVWERAADRYGARVRWAEVDIETGELPAWQFAEILDDSTAVVAVTAASSTIGTVTDVAAIGAAAHEVGALFVVDATSAAPYSVLDIEAMGADVLVVSAERWGGPQVAALVFRDPARIAGLRSPGLSGTTTGPGRLEVDGLQHAMLAGLASSVEHLASLDDAATGTRRERLVTSMTSLNTYLRRLTAYLVESVSHLSSVHLVGSPQHRVPTVSFTVDGVVADKVARRLADNGICALVDVPNRALDVIGVRDVGGAVTIGLGQYSTPYEVDQLVRCLGSLG
ncbi:cysteine desulfurase family protein, VC1184 subfamily [Williamsia deligens]|nr:cysteine desulfurase family protein, VC1184 subfamily [Williamsia deligens]